MVKRPVDNRNAAHLVCRHENDSEAFPAVVARAKPRNTRYVRHERLRRVTIPGHRFKEPKPLRNKLRGFFNAHARGPTPCKPVGLAPANRPGSTIYFSKWGCEAGFTSALQADFRGSTPRTSTNAASTRRVACHVANVNHRVRLSVAAPISLGRVARRLERPAHNWLVSVRFRARPPAGDAAHQARFIRAAFLDRHQGLPPVSCSGDPVISLGSYPTA